MEVSVEVSTIFKTAFYFVQRTDNTLASSSTTKNIYPNQAGSIPAWFVMILKKEP
jgi:hypothetical protein